MSRINLVTLEDDNGTDTHLPAGAGSDHATLCGRDALEDVGARHEDLFARIVPTLKGAKVTCMFCKSIWEVARSVSARRIA